MSVFFLLFLRELIAQYKADGASCSSWCEFIAIVSSDNIWANSGKRLSKLWPDNGKTYTTL